MKHMPLFFVFALSLIAVGCQETSKKTVNNNTSSSNNFCTLYPNGLGCPGATTSGTTTSGTTGSTTGGTTGTTTSGTTGGTTTNPWPFYYSGYVDKNWTSQYPYSPAESCAAATAPSGISYTPYETRKGTITLKGQEDYSLYSGQPFFTTTSELLRTKTGASNFFWGDSILKIRFKANKQPESANTTSVCPNRYMGYSSIKGYGKIKFDLYVVGIRGNTESEFYYSSPELSVGTCSTAINLSDYVAAYPDGIYIRIKNVKGNQNWWPGTNAEAATYDNYGYVSPQNPYVANSWKAIRNMECWSIDIEAASDGTKTFN